MGREVFVLGVNLVGPPEADVALRPRELAFGHQLGERAADLQQVGAAAVIVVGGKFLFLGVRGQHDLLIVAFCAADPALNDPLLGVFLEPGLDLRTQHDLLARLEALAEATGRGARLRARRQPVLELHPGTIGDGESEGVLLALGWAGIQADPGDLVGVVEAARGVVIDHAQRPALPHRLLHDCCGRTGSQHDLVLDALALIVGIGGSGPDVHQFAFPGAAAAVVGDGHGNILEADQPPPLGADDIEFSGERRPAGAAVADIVEDAHIFQAHPLGLLGDPALLIAEATRSAIDAVVEREVAQVVVADIPGDFAAQQAEYLPRNKRTFLRRGSAAPDRPNSCDQQNTKEDAHWTLLPSRVTTRAAIIANRENNAHLGVDLRRTAP